MSCFCWFRTAALLSLQLSILLVVPQASFGGDQTDAVAVQDDCAAEVNALIRDLRDPKFIVRETASQRLAEIGKPAVAALKLATKSDSLEVQVRARSILSGILMDRSSNLSTKEQATIKQFMTSDLLGRVAILRDQARSRNTELFLRLLDVCVADEERTISSEDGVEPTDVKSAIEELIALETDNPLTQWVTNLVSTQRWDEMNKLLTHPGIIKYSPMLRASEARNSGEFDAYIEELYQGFSKGQAAQKTPPTRELVSLIGLLRVKRDFDRAGKVIAVLPDVDLRNRLLRDLLFQQGDWKEILRRTKLAPTDIDYISANPLQQALLFHLLGDQAAIAGVEKELREQLQDAIEAAGEENAGPAISLRSQLRIFGAVTLNWPLVKEFLEKDNLVDNAELMFFKNRPSEVLELLEIGPRFENRQTWAKDALDEIKKARTELAELEKKPRGRRGDDYIRLEKLIKDKQHLLDSVVDIVEQWGLDDEAQLYYQMMFASIDSADSNSEKQEILARLIDLGRTKEYWQLVESVLSGPKQRKYTGGRSWFGMTDASIMSHANRWLPRISGEIVDPVERAKTIAAIVNSPWLDRKDMDFDLDYEIARFRTRATIDTSGGDEFVLGKVLELHGKDEAADALVKQAAQLGYSSAIQDQFFQAIAKEDQYGILEYWVGGSTGPSDAYLIAEEAALKLLETETDPEKIRLIKNQLATCHLAIAAQWACGSHLARRVTSRLGDANKSHLASLRLKCLVYGVPGDFSHRDELHSQLGSALTSEGSNEKYHGAIEMATIMFDQLSYATAAQTDIGWSYSATNLNIAMGQGMIERKKYDQAADFLVRTAEFSPGDVSVGEGTIRKLAEAGAAVAADRVYRTVAKYYVETLEAYPDSPLARNNFAWLSAISNRDLESARRHVSVAVKVRPHVEQYWDTFAELEFLLGNPREAFELSKRCIRLSPARLYYRRQKERFRRAMGE